VVRGRHRESCKGFPWGKILTWLGRKKQPQTKKALEKKRTQSSRHPIGDGGVGGRIQILCWVKENPRGNGFQNGRFVTKEQQLIQGVMEKEEKTKNNE